MNMLLMVYKKVCKLCEIKDRSDLVNHKVRWWIIQRSLRTFIEIKWFMYNKGGFTEVHALIQIQ